MTQRMILLSAADADQVRGPSEEKPLMARLTPLPLTDGRFYLPVQVLANDWHAEDWAFLLTLPQDDYPNLLAFMPAGKP